MKLSKRLELVAQCVDVHARVADIGSDHAYLPSYLAMQQKIDFAIAGEVVLGPFESAKATVAWQKLSHQIDVRLGDGLEVIRLEDRIDTITICGMGGELITQILERGKLAGKLQGVKTLILQPNMAERHVRTWLMVNRYVIEKEYILKENQKIYEIIVARANDKIVRYTNKQLLFGVHLPCEKNEVFVEKWQLEWQKIGYIMSNLKKSSQDETERIKYFAWKKRQIEEMIY